MIYSKPCAGCGCSVDIDVPDVNVDDHLLASSLQRLVDTMVSRQFICDKCDSMLELQRKTGEIERVRNDAVQHGHMSADTKSIRFETSDPAKEQVNQACWDALREWKLRPVYRAAFLHGFPGTGKTYAARCLLNSAIDRGFTVMETNAAELVKFGFRFSDKTMFDHCQSCGFLLLDDLDKQAWDAKTLSVLWQVIDARYTGGGKTVMTANVSPAELTSLLRTAADCNQTLADSIMDRFNPCLRLMFEGKSFRRG